MLLLFIFKKKLKNYLPIRAPTLLSMIKEATPPSSVPTKIQPIASGNGLPVYCEIAMQLPATTTPATAAVSSNNTTFTDGSELRITVI